MFEDYVARAALMKVDEAVGILDDRTQQLERRLGELEARLGPEDPFPEGS